jgi:hypothetical protein
MIRIICALLLMAISFSGAQALTTEALLDSLQYTSFRFFWNEANPANGLIKDRSTPASASSIASVGFGLTAICIGIDHGWVSRTDGRDRVQTTLNTFWNGPQGSGASGYIGYKGLFYHFLDMNTALRTWNSEVSTIDSALLFAGILDAKQYFSTSDPGDIQVRAIADSIYQRADWNFFRNFNQGILMGWKPGTGFAGYGQWIGYNEAMIMYILALGSPTHAVPDNAWSAWTSGYDWLTYNGRSFVSFPPLFGHQYSHCWIDFRYIRDAYMQSQGLTYFENSRRATLAQRDYCVFNPGHYPGYGETLWGLTACDDPYQGYLAHGAPPPQSDNGTIAPTAAAGSIAFAPEEALLVLHNLYDSYRPQLWGPYGFKDAFNLTANWWDTDYLGIDEGPIIIMIENYLNGRVWSRFKQNADIQRGLQHAGFSLAADVVENGSAGSPDDIRLALTPNPFPGHATFAYRLPSPGHVTLIVADVVGREVARLVDGPQSAGEHFVTLADLGLPSGAYFSKLEFDGRAVRKRCVLVR